VKGSGQFPVWAFFVKLIDAKVNAAQLPAGGFFERRFRMTRGFEWFEYRAGDSFSGSANCQP
jgi:hypothetical protein